MKHLSAATISLCLFICLSCMSCDPELIINWQVDNQTSSNLAVSAAVTPETINETVDQGATVTFYQEISIGLVQDYSTDIIFDSLFIRNSKGLLMKKDVRNTKNWITNILDDGLIEQVIVVRDEDF